MEIEGIFSGVQLESRVATDIDEFSADKEIHALGTEKTLSTLSGPWYSSSSTWYSTSTTLSVVALSMTSLNYTISKLSYIGSPTSYQYNIPSNYLYYTSPPLSDIELRDIQAGLKEFSRGKAKIYNNVDDFLEDLHMEREKFQKKKRHEGYASFPRKK